MKVWFSVPLSSWVNEGAFRRQPLREPLHIGTIIVNHVIVLHPFQPSLTGQVQLLREPRIFGGVWVCGAAWRFSGGPNTSCGCEVSEGSSEGLFSPVRLHKAASRGPVVRIPETCIHPHWLVFWVWNTLWFRILEHSDGCAIDVEAGKKDRACHPNYQVRNCLFYFRNCFICLGQNMQLLQGKKIQVGWSEYLHDGLGIPEDGIRVKISSRVEP